MKYAVDQLKAHVRELAASPTFLHHTWFVQWHIELVERIALELAAHYPASDTELIELLAWVHDYGKVVNRGRDEHTTTLMAAPPKLHELGFDEQTIETLMVLIKRLDNYQDEDLTTAPIEVQIVSSADGCAHLTGPFMQIFWQEFADRPYAELMQGNLTKAKKDWHYKIVLPEARQAFEHRYQTVLEQNGELPEKLV